MVPPPEWLRVEPGWGYPQFATRFTSRIGTRMRMALNAVEECEHLNHTPISVRAELWGGTKLEEPTSDRPLAKSANTPVSGYRGEI